MKTELQVFFLFFRAWLFKLTTSEPRSEFQYAADNLFRPTFRVPESERYDPLLVLKRYAEALRFFFVRGHIQQGSYVADQENSGCFVYEVIVSEFDVRRQYVEFFNKKKVGGGIFKNSLYFFERGFGSTILLFLFTFWCPLVFLHSLFVRDKAPLAMLFREIAENANLLKISDKLAVNELFFFCIFEKDANLATVLLRRNGVKVTKIPSEVPLGIWNKTIIADKLCFCSGYQQDELEFFSTSMFVKETDYWGPELMLKNVDKYNKPTSVHKNTIGFYSTGSWVRKLENHFSQNFDAEDLVLRSVGEFCSENPEYKLLVFLHPRESSGKYFPKAVARYEAALGSLKFRFSESGQRTADCFEMADIAVALNSTIMYERLYYGFKTLFMPIGFDNFPIETSKMRNICLYTKEDLKVKLMAEAPLSNKEFFERNGIVHFAKYLFN